MSETVLYHIVFEKHCYKADNMEAVEAAIVAAPYSEEFDE